MVGLVKFGKTPFNKGSGFPKRPLRIFENCLTAIARSIRHEISPETIPSIR